jgi:hypothetical protein
MKTRAAVPLAVNKSLDLREVDLAIAEMATWLRS